MAGGRRQDYALTRWAKPRSRRSAWTRLRRAAAVAASPAPAWTGASAVRTWAALGAALLDALTERGWVSRDLDSRAVRLTRKGERQFPAFFGDAGAQAVAGKDWDIASRPAAA